jgi:hypothetical protein
MGNTCGTCAFDNRGTEVDMKHSKQINNDKGGKGAAAGTTYQEGYNYDQTAGQFDNPVNLNDTQEFLEPPEYQCDAVMVSFISSFRPSEETTLNLNTILIRTTMARRESDAS